ncbi:HD-GYP domain-containing protein [Desulfurispira natronophila]|uniref:HD-GYP domain-containing protein (C-di-GMP phosphodiesterase class II) n=1 Tax=Desulfurispira natronophila TaxID=682562 RepID=A0A7W7Y5T3_9BACT|nr:HD domain-containing phosphohydrolase [Desulfurispira natronophila]MBB5022594.1 HD-GYP domain-containing protein (c-di-GMP phosphodiesterase class II) [Desulfurispira natronophila]
MDNTQTIHTQHLKRGHILAKTVVDQEGYTIAEAHTRLYSPAIKRIRDAGIESVEIFRSNVKNPQARERLRMWEPQQVEETPYRHELGIVRTAYDFLASLLTNNAQQISQGSEPSLSQEQIFSHLNDLMESYLRNYRALLSLSGMAQKRHSPQVQHALRRTLIACALATHITKGDRQETLYMTAASLLADIGMHRIPTAIINKPGKLDEQERKVLETHPILAARILQKRNFPQPVLRYILEHHERLDGTGYPKGLAGNDISLGAALVGLCDTYCAMTSVRSYRGAENPTMALAKILQGKGVVHHGELVDKLVRYIGIFPIGTIVKLSTDEIGVVNQHFPDAPLRPRVAVGINERGQKAPRPFLRDLKTEEDIKIMRVVDPQAVSLDVGQLLYLR